MTSLLIALALLAQILDPNASQQAYTTADPNNPDRIGIATQNDGRYSVTPQSNCDWLAAGQNILIYPAYQMPPWLTLSGLDGGPDGSCVVQINGRMSNTNCFTNDDDVCDVALDPPGPTS